MKLYHGSCMSIEKPDLEHSRINVDFGKGFYVTPNYDQARKWCERFKKCKENEIISCYKFDESAYNVLHIKKVRYVFRC